MVLQNFRSADIDREYFPLWQECWQRGGNIFCVDGAYRYHDELFFQYKGPGL